MSARPDDAMVEVHEGHSVGYVIPVRLDAADARLLDTVTSKRGWTAAQALRHGLRAFEKQPTAGAVFRDALAASASNRTAYASTRRYEVRDAFSALGLSRQAR